MHAPVALQTSSLHSFVSLGHGVPAGSSRQRAEQQSPLASLPSSQFSSGSITPFPHLVDEKVPLQGPVPTVHVECDSSPSSVPTQTIPSQSPVICPLTTATPVAGSTVPARETGYVVEPKEQEPLT